MVDIFNEPTIEQQIKDLNKQGLSIRQIAERLDISKSKVGRMLNESVPSVPQKANIVPDIVPSVPECPKIEQTEGQIESVADLKTKLNLILKEIYSKFKILNNKLENLSETLQEEFNQRVDKVLKYRLNNALEGLKQRILKELKEDVNES